MILFSSIESSSSNLSLARSLIGISACRAGTESRLQEVTLLRLQTPESTELIGWVFDMLYDTPTMLRATFHANFYGFYQPFSLANVLKFC